MSPIYQKTLIGGGMWSQVIACHRTVRLTDLEGGANVGMLLYSARDPLERYSMPDTLKGQHTFQLTAEHCLHSDMGRLLASITRDTAGWHDSVCGTTDAAQVIAQYGGKTYQAARNDFHRNGRDNFLIELAKHGLGVRDLVPNLNLFSKAVADDEGALSFVEGASSAGASIDLRLEMDSLVVLHTCPHPFDPAPTYAPKPVHLQVFESPTPDLLTDACYHSRPENHRAALNTRDYHALLA